MKKLKSGLLFAASVAAFQAHAFDSDMFSVRGFGSVGVVNSSFGDADFTTDAAAPKGAGYSDEWSFSQMSRIGVQLDGQFNDQWSAAVQVLSEYNYEGNYSPIIPFAYVKYEPLNNLSLRAGRLVNPVYMLTDFARVGYALPWARPPLEMYKNYPAYEGVDVNARFNVSDVAFNGQAFYGTSTYKLPPSGGGGDPVTSESDPTWGAILTAYVGNATLRAGHLQATSDYDVAGIDNLLSLYQTYGFNDLATTYNPDGNTSSYDAVGLAYDPGNWFLRTEIGFVSWSEKSLFPSYNTGYVSAGYRYDAFTPYAIYSWYKIDSDTTIGSDDPLTGINAVMAAGDGSRHTTSVGMRWDFMDSMDLKVQLSHVKRDSDTSNMGLTNLAAGASVPSSYNVIFAGVDFVF